MNNLQLETAVFLQQLYQLSDRWHLGLGKGRDYKFGCLYSTFCILWEVLYGGLWSCPAGVPAVRSSVMHQDRLRWFQASGCVQELSTAY